MHFSTKTYGHEVGLSACFRQWRADSHCNKLHGYALAVTLIFGAKSLDSRNWVVDFGALKAVKQNLQESFDHKTLVAYDDPQRAILIDAHSAGVIDMVEVPAVGCEAFARSIHHWVSGWLEGAYLQNLAAAGISPPTDLHLVSVEVREHGANSAIYKPAFVPPHRH